MADPPDRQERHPGRALATVQLLLIAAAFALAVTLEAPSHWLTVQFLVLAVFTGISDLAAIEADSGGFYFSGSFLGIVLTAVLLGGAPACLVGILTIAVGWLRSREQLHDLRNNLVIFAWFPLLTGMFFSALLSFVDAPRGSLDADLCVGAAFAAALLLNFIGFAAYSRYCRGFRILDLARDAVLPVLPAQLFAALLTVAAVAITQRFGTPGLLAFGLVLGIFQYLLGELLKSRQRSRELERIATTDGLTGLPNRGHFDKELSARIEAAPELPLAVMIMDLDRFKEVNDTLGHEYGDRLLAELGPQLSAAVAERGMVARLGGDEFAVLLHEDVSDASIRELVARLRAIVAEPVVVDDLSLDVDASIGVARYPRDARDRSQLLRCADHAMYAAKVGRLGFAFYSSARAPHPLRRMSVLAEVRDALRREEMVVHYQPIVDVSDRTVAGAEALVRWAHPEHGLVSPAAFIPAVEQTGLIAPLTRYVLERAIAECARWQASGRRLMTVSVNLSVRNLLDRALPGDLAQMLRAHGVAPSSLRLEITESLLMTDVDRALTTVGRLFDLGVRLSVDDFGTACSSLVNLRRLPIDELKIDRSFVGSMMRDPGDLVIVRSTINLAHDLGLRVVAEGVEDADTLDELELLGCDLAQGYHFAAPADGAAAARWLAQHSPGAGETVGRHSPGAVGIVGRHAPAADALAPSA